MENPFLSIENLLQELLAKMNSLSTIPPPRSIEIITQQELSNRLGISKPTIIRWVKKGKIPELRFGTSRRYNWYSVIDALEKK
jgi:excisionase family DNA binding protein